MLAVRKNHMTGFSTHNESSRLAALQRYAVLDTAAEAIFDQFAALGAQLLEAPIGIVGMIDQDRHWFKAAHGTQMKSNSRQNSFCTYTVQSDQVFTVGDATRDQRFANNPAVTGATHIRSYAGAPLVTADGLSIGTLCIFDTRPRDFSATECETLTQMAALVMRELEARLERLNAQAGETVPAESRLQALERAVEGIGTQLGLRVRALFTAPIGLAPLELGALSRNDPEILGSEISSSEISGSEISGSEILEEVFSQLRRSQPEVNPDAGLKPKMLERVRFANRHTARVVPARALVLADQRLIVAHAFEPDVPLRLWAKQPGLPVVMLEDFVGAAVLSRLPDAAAVIGLSAQSVQENVLESEWLALGTLIDF
jgi:GAF domain